MPAFNFYENAGFFSHYPSLTDAFAYDIMQGKDSLLIIKR